MIKHLAISSLMAIACVGSPNIRTPPRPAMSLEVRARVRWLAEHAIPMRSIDPNDDDFADLARFRELIGDAKIIMLGEQSHGDGTTFLAKTRLIEFLHREMGFNALAFESGFYDCWRGWRDLQGSDRALDPARIGLLSFWSDSAQVQPLLQYLASTARTAHPLQLWGIDVQLTGNLEGDQLVSEIRQLFEHTVGNGSITDTQWRDVASLVRQLRTNWVSPDPERIRRGTSAVRTLQARLAREHSSSYEIALWSQVLANLYQFAHYGPRGPSALAYERDRIMADNLAWIVTHNPGTKLIVWAASSHVARSQHLLDADRPATQKPAEMKTMGDHVLERFGSDAFVVGFTAYDGAAGSVGKPAFSLRAPERGSLEDLLGQTDLENAIVDLCPDDDAGRWLHEPLHARPFGYADHVGPWCEVMDAMVFTRHMSPSRQR